MFTITDVLEATQGKLIQGDPREIMVEGVSTDTRTLKPGELFVALKGERYDGHAFLNESFKKGGIGAVISILQHRIPETAEEEQLRRGKVIVGVNDTLTALQGLARFHRKRSRLPLLVVTGSNGKTTTKEMTARILSQNYNVLKSEENINNQIGVPLTLLRITSRHELAIVEMGISSTGELRKLAQIANPQLGLITNIGPTHLETLGNINGVAKAKGELLEMLPAKDGIAILNKDDSFFEFLKQKASCHVVTFGLHAGAQVRAVDLTFNGHATTIFRLMVKPEVMELGTRFKRRKNKATATDITIRLPLLGIHNVINALAASAVAVIFGCPLECIKQALESFEPVSMRSQLLHWQGVVIFNDAYNANPASMRAALDVLGEFETEGRRIAVLGDMLELGQADQQAHQEIGQHMARISEGRLIAIGSRARLIADTALSSGMSPEWVSVCESPNEASEVLKRNVRRGDVLLVKGSRRMHLERIIEDLRELRIES